MRLTKLGFGAGSAICAAAFLAATWSTGALADSRPDISVAVNKLARNLDPAKQTGNVDVRVYFSIFDTLIRRDFRNPPAVGAKLIPGLATSWKRVDPKTLELKLRKGVSCHDGNPFNADDVLATFSKERLIGEKSYFPRGRPYFGHVSDVQKVDDFTVRFVTKEVDLILEHRLASYTSFIICDEAWNAFRVEGEDYKVWMDKAFKALRWKPVATGPYKMESYRKNDHIKIVSNDGYWGGKPAAKSVTFKAVPEVAARIAGIVSGEYQISVEIPPDQWEVLDRYDDIVTKSVVLDNTHVLVFNQADPVLSSKKLRHAMSLAIDRKKLIDALWKGQTFTPNGHQLKSFGDMYQADRKGYAFDPEKAKQLVKESGYDGSEISYRLIPAYYLNNAEAAQAIQEMWRQVGINAKLEFVESFKKVRAKGAQIYAWSNTFRLTDPTGALMANWGPSSGIQAKYKFFTPPKEYNDLGTGLFGMTDMKERSAAFNRMLDIFEDEMGMTMLYNPIVTFAVNKNLDWTPYSLFFMDFGPTNFSVK
ncbi:MAG: oligopeptide ABC transporter substrate-binding protein [Rhodospirillales bacterium]|jgi:peptide/nickel transport system substrate-binding protein|nr:oligopeptide ABC transporter substrate-binding protein [Rhodospirillales bacterium]